MQLPEQREQPGQQVRREQQGQQERQAQRELLELREQQAQRELLELREQQVQQVRRAQLQRLNFYRLILPRRLLAPADSR